MKLKNRNLLIIAALAFMTNGLSLLGLEYGSAGALARTLECNSNIARNLQIAQQLKRMSTSPPPKADYVFVNSFEPSSFSEALSA
ncbi:hypothetical protein [Pseudomonas sp. M30-35]|uniref:hypothetical protein n=1 Tax=Pseudomonas sp. M30-35 TaxID=1981174 RepID=UPI000B3D1A1D|nr:hypothetical protein [Pseudomonas sp. M30-35]ARU88159.1 hypothetical protein B9K09_09335 [Pseudomonas sp. M30-35]